MKRYWTYSVEGVMAELECENKEAAQDNADEDFIDMCRGEGIHFGEADIKLVEFYTSDDGNQVITQIVDSSVEYEAYDAFEEHNTLWSNK